MGTIVRFKADGSEFEVFARGMRNIYGITFDNQGRLFGVDNDGNTLKGFRREEVLQIKHGAHYGYPFEGTFDTRSIRTDEPIWIMDNAASGSAGIAMAADVGLEPGLLIGGPHLTYLPLSEDDSGLFVPSKADDPSINLMSRVGFFTIVNAGPENRLFVGVLSPRQSNELFVLRFDQ